MTANGHLSVVLPLTDELLETLAARVAALLEGSRSGSDDRWVRGAEAIGKYIDAPASRVFALSSAGRIPVHRDGSALVAKRSELDGWILAGGGRRP